MKLKEDKNFYFDEKAADFNSDNNVVWFLKLKEYDRQTLLIEQNDKQTKYEIAIVLTDELIISKF